jgi:hypothetical protein
MVAMAVIASKIGGITEPAIYAAVTTEPYNSQPPDILDRLGVTQQWAVPKDHL